MNLVASILIETLKKSIGVVDRVQVRVRLGSLMRDQSSELISFPKICPVCLKPTKGESKVETTLFQMQKMKSKGKKDRVQMLSFEVPMCAECSEKRSKTESFISSRVSPMLILLVLFYVGKHAGQIRDTVLKWIPSHGQFYVFALILPLMLAIMYVIEKRSGDPILISEISVGKDNPRLLERLTKMRDKKGVFVQAELDPESHSSVTFSFRNLQYASLFAEENKTLLV